MSSTRVRRLECCSDFVWQRVFLDLTTSIGVGVQCDSNNLPIQLKSSVAGGNTSVSLPISPVFAPAIIISYFGNTGISSQRDRVHWHFMSGAQYLKWLGLP